MIMIYNNIQNHVMFRAPVQSVKRDMVYLDDAVTGQSCGQLVSIHYRYLSHV